jgi:hypothetical protein
MPSKFQNRVAEGAAPYLEPGEKVYAAMSAALKGRTQQVAGAFELGSAQTATSRGGASQAGLVLPTSQTIGVVVTSQRLLFLELAVGAKVKGLTSSVPLADVDSIDVKRLGLGGTTTVTVRSAPIRFEGRVGMGRELQEGLAEARAGQ